MPNDHRLDRQSNEKKFWSRRFMISEKQPDPTFAISSKTHLRPIAEQTGASILASFVTENHPNTFPRLPVREDANVFVWFSFFPNRAALEQHTAVFADLMAERQLKLSEVINGQPEILVLAPTARSLLQ
jgi:hypothetical protein